ncbi:MAG: MSEP-CTERM sorting domain-containing protein [Saprospiraceae bacterium]|nr:MSEP-CTERM sorting domain-containing protein [Saprospiraceae bacterium]
MKNLLNPKWIFLINTIPIVVLFFIFFGEYNIIKSLLTDENLIAWKKFGLILGILGTLNFLYAVLLVVKRKEVSAIYGVVALLIYIPFLYLYGNYAEDIIPFNIPQWMISDNMFLYVGTFIMPTLAYSLFVLVTYLTPNGSEKKAWKNFLVVIIIPISWYLFTQVIIPFWQPVGSNFSMHTIIIFIIISTLIFLFFLIRAIYILGLKKASAWSKYQLAWKIPISIVLPLLGLAINNGLLFKDVYYYNSGIFGDFHNIWFYILAVANGVFICLPGLENKLYRLLLFIGRTVTFAFTLYFFMVFIPFLPLSVIAILAFGAGFLMLTPLVLFVIHLSELTNDFKFLINFFSKKLVRLIAILSFFVLPVIITITYLKDRSVLNETLDYLYAPDYSKNYNINETSLSKTIDVVKRHKERNNDFIFSSQIPYLTSYFNWLVLENLTLSDSKINNIENVFFANGTYNPRSENIRNENVEISNVSSSSRFDKSQNAWISWVDLEITNNSTNNLFAEYATTIELPVGCWISDYYLYVGKRKEMGILAEKKSAIWVFSQIRNANRDPGILYYLGGNKVAFRVFPFSKEEIRKTGIEFIHKETVKLNFDGNIIELGNNSMPNKNSFNTKSDDNVIYITAQEKSTLMKVQRKPYYHFLVDVSEGGEKHKDEFVRRIENLLKRNIISSDNAQISFVNSFTSTFLLNNNWKQRINEQKFQGGFYLDRAIKTTLFHSYKSISNSYPIIVTITDNIENAIIEKDFSDFKMAYPESDLFYNLNKYGDLKPHSLSDNPIRQIHDTLNLNFNNKVLAFPNSKNPIAYLSDNQQSSIILKNDLFEINDKEIKEKNWQSALELQAMWISQVLHPETTVKEWLNLVKYSFISKIMCPVTSYMVVENEAQKAILKKKQEQVLSSNKSLDIGEDTQRMSEPSLILLILLIGLLFWFKKKRIRQWVKMTIRNQK